MLGQNDFLVSSCHPYHIDNGYSGNLFGVSPDIIINNGATVITLSYAELNYTFTVKGEGSYSTDNCSVTYVYLDGDLNEIFNEPIINGVNIQIHRCTLDNANNYNVQASINDNSCIIEGCTNTIALNYNSLANQDDETCILKLGGISNQLSHLYQQINDVQSQLVNYFSCQEILQIMPINVNSGWNMIGYSC